MTPENGPVVQFDHHSPEHSRDTVASYRALREAHPLAWTPAHGGYWVLSGYQDVFDAARDEVTFSSARSSHGGEGLNNVIPKVPVDLHIPVELDPPQWRAFRKILNPVTSPAAVAEFADRIEHYTTWFIDEVIESGTCDFATVIGVPSAVTLDWLGLPVADWPRYAGTLHAMLSGVPGSPAHVEASQVGVPWMAEQLRQAIAERRVAPTSDLISYLLRQQVDGRPITDHEAHSMIELLISGGVGTTASLVSQTLVHLSRHPAQRQELLEHPELLERGVEEFLRAFSPAQALARTVTRDVEFHGCPLHAGDRVLIAWASANRDAAVFAEPDEVDLHRWPNRHTAFGMGIHRCAGAHLARAMARSLIGQILNRMPDFEIDLDRLQPYPQQGTNAGWQYIPARFTPGPRLGPATL